MSWPAPWRKAASPSVIAASVAPSALSSGQPGVRAEARLVHVGRVEVEAEDVGLERLEAALLHVLAELHHVVERAHRLDAHHLGIAEAVAAAMRPVERQAVAHRPAEQLVDRNAQRLGLDVEQRVLDRGHRLLVDAARRLARDGVLAST